MSRMTQITIFYNDDKTVSCTVEANGYENRDAAIDAAMGLIRSIGDVGSRNIGVGVFK